MTRSSMLRLYALEAWYEVVKVWRTPGYTIPAITFPLAFYLLFAILIRPGGRSSLSGLAVYLVATYGACGLMGAALQSFGVGLAIERGQGWLQVKRAAPMPLAAYFTAKLAMVLAFGVVGVGRCTEVSDVGETGPSNIADARVPAGGPAVPFSVLGAPDAPDAGATGMRTTGAVSSVASVVAPMLDAITESDAPPSGPATTGGVRPATSASASLGSSPMRGPAAGGSLAGGVSSAADSALIANRAANRPPLSDVSPGSVPVTSPSFPPAPTAMGGPS